MMDREPDLSRRQHQHTNYAFSAHTSPDRGDLSSLTSRAQNSSSSRGVASPQTDHLILRPLSAPPSHNAQRLVHRNYTNTTNNNDREETTDAGGRPMFSPGPSCSGGVRFSNLRRWEDESTSSFPMGTYDRRRELEPPNELEITRNHLRHPPPPPPPPYVKRTVARKGDVWSEKDTVEQKKWKSDDDNHDNDDHDHNDEDGSGSISGGGRGGSCSPLRSPTSTTYGGSQSAKTGEVWQDGGSVRGGKIEGYGRSPSNPTTEPELEAAKNLNGAGRGGKEYIQHTSSSLMWDHGYGAYVPKPTVGQPKVYIRVVFLKIGEIDTLKETFRAEIFVQARWREPSLDHCKHVDEVQWDELWNPRLQVENAMDEPQCSKWYDLSLSPEGQAYVLEKRRLKADFAETLELQDFPFDMQHLSVLIISQLSDASLDLLEDEEELSSVNLLSFVDEQEWDVRDIVEALPEVRSREFSQVKHNFPMITVRTYAFRRAGFFVWNVLAIMVLICSLSLCTFSVDRTLPQNRLQLSFTLMLTGIAFKFVVGQSLPKISYLTVLDKYILGSMILMHVVSVWHAIVSRLKDQPSLASTADDWAFGFFVLFFVIYNVGYALIMLVKTYMERKCITALETEYQAKVKKLIKDGADTSRRNRVMKKAHKTSPSSSSRVHALA